jgi:hypothetical protein
VPHGLRKLNFWKRELSHTPHPPAVNRVPVENRVILLLNFTIKFMEHLYSEIDWLTQCAMRVRRHGRRTGLKSQNQAGLGIVSDFSARNTFPLF